MYVSACGNVTCEYTTQGLQKKVQVLWHWSSGGCTWCGSSEVQEVPSTAQSYRQPQLVSFNRGK